MVRYPQEILRRRTRQDLLRQRQAELRKRIEQPTPEQPQATQQEIQEYEKLKQQWDEQQSKLQTTISDVESQIATNMANFQAIKDAIERKKAANPEYTSSFDRRRAAEYANRVDELRIREQILKGSYSVEEASAKYGYYRGQRAERFVPVAPAKIVPREKVSEMYKQEMRIYQKQGFSKSEAEYLARRGQQEQVTYLPAGAKRLIQERGVITQDVKTYQRQGFSQAEAQFLAEKGAEQQITFTKEGARRIIQERTYGIREGVLVPTRAGEELIGQQLYEKMSPEQKYREYIRATSASELIEKGDYPALVLKGFYRAGEEYVGVIARGVEEFGVLTPSERRAAGEIVGEVGMWGFFSPAFATGVAAKLKKPVKLSETRFKELEEFYGNIKADLVTKKVGKEQTKYLENVYNKFFKGKDRGKEAFKKMIEDLYEGGFYKGIPLEFAKQAPKEAPVLFEITAELPYIRGAVAPAQIIRAGEQLFFKEAAAVKIKEKVVVVPRMTARERQLYLQTQITRQRFGQLQLLGQPQLFFQPSLLAQVPRLAMPSLFKWPTPTRVKPRVKLKVKPKIPIPIPIPRLSEASKEKVMKALKKLRGKSVNVLIGMEKGKQKIVYKNLPPRKAYMKAQQFVDKNIQASFRIIPTGKKTKKKDIKKITFSGKFRLSKRNPLFQVEKSKYRLDTTSEVSQLKAAKRRKK